MKKRFSTSVVALLFVLLVTACGGQSADGERPGTATPAVEGETPSKDNPLVINKEQKTVSVYAEVNGKYLYEPTRHGLNFHEGNYGDQAIFKSYANPLDFHDALIELGAEPGNNLGGDSKDTFIEGESLDITVHWEGADKVYSLDEVIIDSTGKPIDQKFGGNLENAMSKFTGCLMCLDSCMVGITSNSAHPTGTFENGDAEFTGNPDVLPGDGTPVVVTFQIQ
jgi:hypothetical protein